MAVYFVEATGLNLVKIGFAGNPWRRLNKLRADCPVPVAIIGIVDGGAEVEATMHTRFREHRQRGEWFRLDPPIRTFVAALPPVSPPLGGRLMAGPKEAHRSVIARFGGMREMARKLGHVSHTTVQGWWGRSKIPSNRWSEIMAAAAQHGVQIEAAELLPEASA